MRILLLTKYFPPEIGTAAHLFFELAESLLQRGHQVTVITGFPWYNVDNPDEKYRGKIFLRETLNGIQVIRIAMPRPPKGLLRYKTGHVMEPPVLFVGGLLSGEQDIVVAYSPPLLVGFAAYLLGKLKRIPSVVNVQDLHPQCLIDLGQLKNLHLIRLLEAIESFIYRKTTCITVHSEGNRRHVLSKGGTPDRVLVIPNWVDTKLIRPSDRLNGFRRENDLNDKFVVSFAGTMGIAQGLESVLESAALLRNYEDIFFVLVGDGVKREALVAKAQQMRLPNVKFLPMQPREKYPEILNGSDVCLVTLGKDVSTPVVPSKLLSIMAAGRPVIASVPLNGDTHKIIKAARCGYCIEPENPEQLSQAILDLYRNPSLAQEFGKNGRCYAEEHFSREAVIGKYELLFMRLTSRNDRDGAFIDFPISFKNL